VRTWQGIAIGFSAFGLAAAGWLITDSLEANDDFCNACHLPSGSVLHAEIRRGFDSEPASNLAGVHGSATSRPAGRERAFRCIDCHGGTGLLGRAKVKMLAAKDALVWLSGDFDEPDHMQYPLGEADCRQCHRGFESGKSAEDESRRFHALAVHNADLGVGCVECHTVHDGGDDAELFFLNAARVRKQCARCHSEFQQNFRRE
jgi:hypothetical protein